MKSEQYKRAISLANGYKYLDKRSNIGVSSLTPKWIYDNILFKSCVHCGKTGWNVIGCNRLDNSKPHTMDNVEPCCLECNLKLEGEYYKDKFSKKVYQYDFDGNLLKIWNSVRECGRNGFNQASVCLCCNGKKCQYKGFIWKYKED